MIRAPGKFIREFTLGSQLELFSLCWIDGSIPPVVTIHFQQPNLTGSVRFFIGSGAYLTEIPYFMSANFTGGGIIFSVNLLDA